MYLARKWDTELRGPDRRNIECRVETIRASELLVPRSPNYLRRQPRLCRPRKHR